MLIFRIVILIFLVLIATSLFTGLRFMFRKQGRDVRMARALTVRIVLSLTLFFLLIAAFYFGLIPARGR